MISYMGGFANVRFTIKYEEEQNVIDLYADGNHFYTQKFDKDIPHQEIVAKCYADIFGGR